MDTVHAEGVVVKPRESAGTPQDQADVSAGRPAGGLRLDALPPGMAGAVLNSLIRSAATAASREMARTLFKD